MTAITLQHLKQDPENDDLRLVYADALQASGDPRGELIMLHHRKSRGADVSGREQELMAAHARAFCGPLHGVDGAELEFHLGFVDVLGLRDADPAAVAALLRSFLTSPAGALLRTLTIHDVDEPLEDVGCQSLVDLVCELRPVTLRRLSIGTREPDWDEDRGDGTIDASRLLAALPRLRDLALAARCGFDLGRIDHARLESFSLSSPAISAPNLTSLCSARWPRLRRLALDFGVDPYGEPGQGCTADALIPLLTSDNMPGLRELSLTGLPRGDELCDLLPALRTLPQLQTLDLSRNQITPDGARTLLDQRAVLRNLRSLDLSENFLETYNDNTHLLEQLGELCDHVLVDNQADPDFSPAGDYNDFELLDDLTDDETAIDERAIHEALSRDL
jgi:uncharacterized protein (TIGR02996 family)